MTKFSDFIRNPGTAGPPTQEGISALGFVLNTDLPGILGKYVRVDAAQSFSAGEKTQARANIGAVIGTDVQAFSASLTSLAGLATSANQLAYTTAPNTWAVTSITAYGRSLVAAADAAAGRTALGLGTISTQNANSVAITGGSVAGITDLAVADGGTGASTAAAARTNLGLVIGTDVQAQDAQLQAVADLTGVAGSFIRWAGVASAVMQAIVGTVSQSGGTPTGAIIETGLNGSGRFIKYADGTMICTKSVTIGTVGFSASNNVFISSAQALGSFAAAFVAAPVQHYTVRASSGLVWPTISSAPTASDAGSIFIMSSGGTTVTGTVADITAIGRWF